MINKDDENNKKSKNTIITPNFEILSYGTLRRYQAYYNLRDDLTRDKNKMIKIVSNHFSTLEVDPESVLENFIRIEKDQQPDKNNISRKSVRCQEKNLTKIIDHYANNK